VVARLSVFIINEGGGYWQNKRLPLDSGEQIGKKVCMSSFPLCPKAAPR
jgi:hypothetical protein